MGRDLLTLRFDVRDVARTKPSCPTLHERRQNATVSLRNHMILHAGGFDQQGSPCVQ
jgi:hypothetical protein